MRAQNLRNVGRSIRNYQSRKTRMGLTGYRKGPIYPPGTAGTNIAGPIKMGALFAGIALILSGGQVLEEIFSNGIAGRLSQCFCYLVMASMIWQLAACANGNSRLHDTSESSRWPNADIYRLNNPSADQLLTVADKFSVIARLEDSYDILVPHTTRSALLHSNLRFSLVEENVFGKSHSSYSYGVPGYHSYSEVVAKLGAIASQYKNISTLLNYGTSLDGRNLYALKISDNASREEADEPTIMITAATHGNELISTEVVLGVIDDLIKKYGKSQQQTSIVNGAEIYFIPIVNPDGFVNVSRYSAAPPATDGPEAGELIDPNRVYPFPLIPNRDIPAKCIADLMKFFEQREVTGALDFHAYGELIGYPWSYTLQKDQLRKDILASYQAEVASLARFNGYRTGQISTILYIAKGTSGDYYHWRKNTVSLVFEVARTFIPHSSEIPGHIERNIPAVYKFIENRMSE